MRLPRTQHTQRLPWLLAAATLLILAAAVMPFDESIATTVRSFSHAVGKQHVVQEVLALVRPFGKADVILLCAMAIGCIGCRRRALQIVLALVLVSVLVWPLKVAVGRERPNRMNAHSFPSGDVATIAALCAPLAQASPWAGAAAVVGTAGVAAGRIYDGRHYPADTLAGAAFGLIAGAVSMRLINRLRRLPRRRWFAIVGVALILVQTARLPWARALPFLHTFLIVWGPLAMLLLLSRAASIFGRRHDPCTDASVQARWGRLLALVTFAVLAHYVLLTSASTLWDRDEPRFSRATVEMVESGNYLYPTFNGDLRPDKPILIYWLMSLPVRLFGPTEMTCRAVAPLASAVAVLLIAWIGRRLAGPLAGLLAALFMATTPLLAASGSAATTDALLLACMTGALAAFIHAWQTGMKWTHVAAMALALGAALLTKGPVGLLPVLIMAVIMATTRTDTRTTVRECLPGILVAVLIAVALFLAWGLPANAATGGEFLRRGLGHHVVARSVTPLESHGGRSFLFAFYYLPLILVTFFPWTLYLVPGLAQGTGAAASRFAHRTAFAWALPVILLMSLVATKLPHYVLPAWPALSLLAALGVLRLRGTPAASAAPLARTGRWVFAVTGTLLGGGLIVAPWFLPVFGIRVPAVSAGATLLGMTWLATRHHARGRHLATIATLLAGMSVTLLTVALCLLPALEPVKLAPRLATVINERTDPGVPVSTCGFGEPTLTFYLHRGPVETLDESALPGWARRPGPGILVVTEPKLQRQWESMRPAPVRVLEVVRGFNYSQGKWVKVCIMSREGQPDESSPAHHPR